MDERNKTAETQRLDAKSLRLSVSRLMPMASSLLLSATTSSLVPRIQQRANYLKEKGSRLVDLITSHSSHLSRPVATLQDNTPSGWLPLRFVHLPAWLNQRREQLVNFIQPSSITDEHAAKDVNASRWADERTPMIADGGPASPNIAKARLYDVASDSSHPTRSEPSKSPVTPVQRRVVPKSKEKEADTVARPKGHSEPVRHAPSPGIRQSSEDPGKGQRSDLFGVNPSAKTSPAESPVPGSLPDSSVNEYSHAEQIKKTAPGHDRDNRIASLRLNQQNNIEAPLAQRLLLRLTPFLKSSAITAKDIPLAQNTRSERQDSLPEAQNPADQTGFKPDTTGSIARQKTETNASLSPIGQHGVIASKAALQRRLPFPTKINAKAIIQRLLDKPPALNRVPPQDSPVRQNAPDTGKHRGLLSPEEQPSQKVIGKGGAAHILDNSSDVIPQEPVMMDMAGDVSVMFDFLKPQIDDNLTHLGFSTISDLPAKRPGAANNTPRPGRDSSFTRKEHTGTVSPGLQKGSLAAGLEHHNSLMIEKYNRRLTMPAQRIIQRFAGVPPSGKYEKDSVGEKGIGFASPPNGRPYGRELSDPTVPRAKSEEDPGQSDSGFITEKSGVMTHHENHESPHVARVPADRESEASSPLHYGMEPASAATEKAQAPNIDAIAREVYRTLKWRLARERERALGLS